MVLYQKQSKKLQENPNRKTEKLISPFSGGTIHWPEIRKIFRPLRNVDRVDTSISYFIDVNPM